VLTTNSKIECFVLRACILACYPTATIKYKLDNINESADNTFIILTKKAAAASFENFKGRHIITVFICWKRQTRRKNVSHRWFSVSTLFKFKRLQFNRKDTFISLNETVVNSLNELDTSFELNIRALNGPVFSSKKEMLADILADPKLADHIKSHPNSKRKIKRYVNEMSTHKSLRTIARISVILDVVWRFTLEGFYVDKKGINRVRELSKKNQIVFMPSHRSHADYLIIGYILYRFGLDTPVTAAGINLAFFPMTNVFRRAGAYFIRRSFQGNLSYSLTFRTYLKMLFRSGGPQMFYIEGGRSRSGKLLPPKLGMLSMILDFYRQGEVGNFYFAPLSMEYGKLFEGQSYIDELRGGEKQKESIFAMFDIFKYFKKKQGITYVQFGEPFSVADYFNAITVKNLSVREYNQSVKQLGNDIIYRVNSIVTVTPSAILSLILLSNPRRGIHEQELLRSCKMIYNYLRTKDVRIAIDKNEFENAFSNVLENFVYNSYVAKAEFNKDIIYKTKDQSRYFLDYYKNNIIHLFLPLAFVAVAIRSKCNDELMFSDLFLHVEELKKLFSQEFVYNEEIWSQKNLLETVKFFAIVKEVKIEDNKITRMHRRGNQWLEICYNILRNFIEGYYIATSEVLNLSEAVSEEKFYSDLNITCIKMFEVGELSMIESNSKDIFRNAMLYCADEKWVSKRGKKIELIASKADEFKAFCARVSSYLV
jgi:glycerol-3-phosphate O-acyltransferase